MPLMAVAGGVQRRAVLDGEEGDGGGAAVELAAAERSHVHRFFGGDGVE